MQIRESGEDYLETILMIQKKNGQVRSIDICNELGYSKPTVSVAMKNFRENGYINMDDDYLLPLRKREGPSLKAFMSAISLFQNSLWPSAFLKKPLWKIHAKSSTTFLKKLSAA